MSVVTDASITLAWIFPDEVTPAVESVFERVERGGALVPALWKFEVPNVLQMAVRAGRYGARFRDVALAQLEILPIETDASAIHLMWNDVVRLADRHRLTVYDASYLELALRRNLPLATLDHDLRSAAASENVLVLGL